MSYLPYDLENIPEHRHSYQLSVPAVFPMPARIIYALYWRIDNDTDKSIYRVVSAAKGTQFGFVNWHADKEPVLKLARLVITAVHGTRSDELLKKYMDAGGYFILPIRPELVGGDATWRYPDWEDDDEFWKSDED